MPDALLSRDELAALVRTIPDFPAAGVLFRDITPLIAHGPGLASAVEHLALEAERAGFGEAAGKRGAIAGIEARGFIFGAALAIRLGMGFVPLRKPGKLPIETLSVDYDLEYGSARLELDPGAIDAGEPVILVDDLIATGGSARAATRLLRNAGAEVTHAFFVIDLPELGGADVLRVENVTVGALMQFPGG